LLEGSGLVHPLVTLCGLREGETALTGLPMP
jgi:hypothetical protein